MCTPVRIESKKYINQTVCYIPALSNGEFGPEGYTDEGNREANIPGEAPDMTQLQTVSHQLEGGDEVKHVWP